MPAGQQVVQCQNPTLQSISRILPGTKCNRFICPENPLQDRFTREDWIVIQWGRSVILSPGKRADLCTPTSASTRQRFGGSMTLSEVPLFS